MIIGLLTLLFAGILQGLFVLPLTFTKNWNWEHKWLMFSFFGMILLNWLIGFILFPQAISVFQKVPARELLLLLSFGLFWGVGAILFGLGMEKLGMSVGYPVIMGLIAGVGTLLPLLATRAESIVTVKGMSIITGCGLVIIGILICSKANAAKNILATGVAKPAMLSGIIIAVLAGILSALPNIGMTFATKTVETARLSGVPGTMAGNVVWLLFFTFGFVANTAYTTYLIIKNNSFHSFVTSFNFRNVFFTLLAACCWIGSFYVYGFSASSLGKFGAIAGWPLFIAVSIITGNLAGIWKGEWRNAAPGSIRLLRYGMTFFIVALIVIGLSNIL